MPAALAVLSKEEGASGFPPVTVRSCPRLLAKFGADGAHRRVARYHRSTMTLGKRWRFASEDGTSVKKADGAIPASLIPLIQCKVWQERASGSKNDVPANGWHIEIERSSNRIVIRRLGDAGDGQARPSHRKRPAIPEGRRQR